ncbi:MAG: DUF560 domain-containing protein [Sphingobium sp.]|nr:DUF560 domain-containing protein [Sphingobium sp.]
MTRSIGLPLILPGLLLAVSAHAQQPAAPEPQPVRIEPVRAAEQLLASGRIDEARMQLLALEAERPADLQVQFLLGLIAVQEKRYDDAIKRFHRILVTEPDNVRVRLELGRAYFLAGNYGDAERQFRFARAGNLPPMALANIDRFLLQIRQLKRFSRSISIAVAPDSNLNAGPSTDAITLYGLPFELSGDARRNSGVGLALGASMAWTAPVAPGTKIRAGLELQRSQYGKTEFDDMTLSAYAGVSRTFTRWDLSLLPLIQRRWYGDRTYMNAWGGMVSANWYPATRTAISANVTLLRRDYPRSGYQDGFGYDLGLGWRYTPTTSSLVGLNAGYGHQDAQDKPYAWHSKRVGAFYAREFKGGLTASIAPSFTMIDYEKALDAFGVRREDRQSTAQLTLLYRKIDIHGFTPRLSYTFTHNASNLPLYRFDRSRFELGITSAF